VSGRLPAIRLPDELVDLIAEQVAEILASRFEPPPASPYLTVEEAAEYLRAEKHRVYDLLSSGRLTRHKDGSRVLVERSELEAYLAGRDGRG
jgi:excisionase family DNA binding protein